jgi:hypothetical protein
VTHEVGDRFGRLRIVTIFRRFDKVLMANVICDCGNSHVARLSYLKSGHTKSCGCLQQELRHRGQTPRVSLEPGLRFGRLVVIQTHPRFQTRGQTVVDVRCDCGTLLTVILQNLVKGATTSCGCRRRDVSKANAAIPGYGAVTRTHGKSLTPEHIVWRGAKTRCHNPRHPAYYRYGGRGIVMCDEWRHSFEAFLAALGPRPAGYTLERVDNERGYEPGNCVWATPKAQANNRRPAIRPRKFPTGNTNEHRISLD